MTAGLVINSLEVPVTPVTAELFLFLQEKFALRLLMLIYIKDNVMCEHIPGAAVLGLNDNPTTLLFFYLFL